MLNEQLFLSDPPNYGGDVWQGRARAALHDSISTQTRKNCVETLHAIQTMYRKALLRYRSHSSLRDITVI